MSFGKLNILQHKTWNVWNRDNIEKVLRDEREHREKEKKERDRLAELESETRTQVLRKRRLDTLDEGTSSTGGPTSVGDGGAAHKQIAAGDEESGAVVAVGGEAGSRHISKNFNLFEGLDCSEEINETSCKGGVANKEREEEKRKEKDKHERQWGLVGLGQDSFSGDSYGAKPWYASSQRPDGATYQGAGQANALAGSVPFGVDQAPDKKQKRDENLKAREDPLADMKKYLKDKKRAKEHKKHKRSHSQGHSSPTSGRTEAEKKDMLDRMRKERAERERRERERVAQIMGGGLAPSAAAEGSKSRYSADDPRSGYSSGFAQFHGGMVRKR